MKEKETKPKSASPKGRATSLCVLPKAAKKSEDAASMISTSAAPATVDKGALIRIAVVEDDEWVRNGLATQIDKISQFRCVGQHRSGEDALRDLPGNRPDVVLMDINLPGINGIECVKRLREALPEANILMLTVYEESEKIFDSLKAGANGYLLKRTPQKELMEAIAHVHAGGSPMTGLIARKVVHYFKQSGQSSSQLETLSAREREILERLGEGEAYKEIADALTLSIDTVRMHIRGIYRKLHVHSRGEAVAKYLRR